MVFFTLRHRYAEISYKKAIEAVISFNTSGLDGKSRRDQHER